MNGTNAYRLNLKRVAPALIILILVLAGLLIYRHSQNRSRARLAAELTSQYKTAATAKKPTKESAALNAQKDFILNFYKDYLAVKNTDRGQSKTVATYGTAKLEEQMKNSTPTFDQITCGSDIDPALVSVSVGNPLANDTDKKIYQVSIRGSNSSVLAAPQVTMIFSNNSYRIDSIGCLGPV